MARTSNNNNLAPGIDAYQRWIQTCLIGDGSILSSENLWTAENVAEVRKAFVDNPDLGEDTFEDKL
jgi:5-methylcytosine-specific restriction protein B